MLKSIAVISAALLLLVSTAHADSKVKDEWEIKSRKIQDLHDNDPDGCDKVFHLLWGDAKKGDLNARVVILYQMTMMHGYDMGLPGATGDYLTRKRHAIIMAAHSIGADSEKIGDGKYYPDIILSSKIAPNSPYLSKAESEFRKCLVESRSNECVKILEKDLIPPFDVFAAEIDTFIKTGHKARCARPQGN